jgi:nucleoside-diphosphate-sugar epimerase
MDTIIDGSTIDGSTSHPNTPGAGTPHTSTSSTGAVDRPFQSAFVTGATGLLGNNLVRRLTARGIRVRALARSREKAAAQFAGLPVEIVTGDMSNVGAFAGQLTGVDVLFHTAAYFRDSYKGGSHWDRLYATNVRGTADLLVHAFHAGVRRIVHTSSTAVLNAPPGVRIDETMRRREADADDYQRSKILSDREIDSFLDSHRDLWACMVLPGFMFGPADIGPTSSGQLVLDFLGRKLPGIPPGSFPVVDARDVSDAMIAAALRGRRGARYIAAGRHMTMPELVAELARVSGVKAPARRLPMALLFAVAAVNELRARVTGQPVLIGLAAARLIARERNTEFSHELSERELGVAFRPVDETLRDVIAWYREHGWLDRAGAPGSPRTPAAVRGA